MLNFNSQVSLSAITAYRIGGAARLYCAPATIDEFVEAVTFARTRSLPFYILGKGSNILVSDAGFEGLLIHTVPAFCKIEWSAESSDNTVRCDSGASLASLVSQSVDHGRAGIELLAGVPGSVAGAVYMNAGAYGQEFSQVVSAVTVLDLSTTTIRTYTAAQCGFGYRTSIFQKESPIILSVTCTLQAGNAESLKSICRETLAKRTHSQPLDLPSCGSVFRRPAGNYAGGLIEAAGLKGYRIGNAQVSPKHANFIVNLGDATAHDVRSLIVHIQKTVFANSAILLEPEVIFVGKFEDGLLTPFA